MSVEKQDDWKRGWRHGASGGIRQTLVHRHRNGKVVTEPVSKEYNDGYDAGVASRQAAYMRVERMFPVDLTERILSQ